MLNGKAVYRCGRFAGFQDFCVGNIKDFQTYEELVSNELLLNYERGVKDLVSRCSDCDYFQFCGGGCYYAGFMTNSLPRDSFTCEYYKRIIPHMVKRIWDSMPSKLRDSQITIGE